MPKNNRESLIYSVLMCFVMVLWMSVYNIVLRSDTFSLHILERAWLGMPIAFVFAFSIDWFLVSKIAKRFAFRFLLKPSSGKVRTVLTVSCCMVLPMVLIMSLYGAVEGCISNGSCNSIVVAWGANIVLNLMMAIPFQILVAGPVVRKVFRAAFPEGKVLE